MQTKNRALPAEILMPAIEEALSQGGSFSLTVTGSSMGPTLHPGRDSVVLTAPKTLQPGQILLFRRGDGSYILHRLLKIRGSKLLMNGDAQTWTEEISASQVVGVVSHICRNGKRYACQSLGSRCYSWLWRQLRPVRPALFRLRKKA